MCGADAGPCTRGRKEFSAMLILGPDQDPSNCLLFTVYYYCGACQHHPLADSLSNFLSFKRSVVLSFFLLPFFLRESCCDLWSPVACSSGSFVNCCQHFLVFNPNTAFRKNIVYLKDFNLAFLGCFLSCVVLARSTPLLLCSCGIGLDAAISFLSHF